MPRSPCGSRSTPGSTPAAYPVCTAQRSEVEVVFEPQEGGGFTVYSPELPGMVTQGETLDEAIEMAEEAIRLQVESMRERGKEVPLDIVRRKFPVPA